MSDNPFDTATGAERERLLREGVDHPMTAEVYGQAPHKAQDLLNEVLPESTGITQGPMSALQRFINMYQPGELVLRQNFRKLYYTTLEEWALSHPNLLATQQQLKDLQQENDSLKAEVVELKNDSQT